ncbi:unnamed protein product [Ectocarpus fasciculatus]
MVDIRPANLSAARCQHDEMDEDHSTVTATASTSSYQSGGSYSSVADSHHYRQAGMGPAPAERFAPSQDHAGVQFSPTAPSFPGTPGPSESLMACHRYSRVVRVLAILDAIVVLCGASAFTPLILMIWGPIAGYLASNFRLRAAFTFLFYYGLRISWDIGWILSGGIEWVVVWVFLFTDIAASGLVYFFVVLLCRCSRAEVEHLRDPNTAWASAFFPLSVGATPFGGSPDD